MFSAAGLKRTWPTFLYTGSVPSYGTKSVVIVPGMPGELLDRRNILDHVTLVCPQCEIFRDFVDKSLPL